MVLACLAHWYISMLYVVPVLGIGLWCWRSTRRGKKPGGPGATPKSGDAPVTPSA